MAVTNKCLAPNNKSRTGGKATKKRETGWISNITAEWVANERADETDN